MTTNSTPRIPTAPMAIQKGVPLKDLLGVEAIDCLTHNILFYVRRSVANHLGDIAKDHPEKVFEVCDRWLNGSTTEVKWLIRHALRHPAKKGDKVALQLRAAAK
jgi:3-methyladenine DNA glycosylase AlkC